MIKRFSLIIYLVSFAIISNGYTATTCAYDSIEKCLLKCAVGDKSNNSIILKNSHRDNPILDLNLSAFTSLTIPVVVHVIYHSALENIPDSQIMKMIEVLNEDFGRTNPDTGNTPAVFQSVAASTNIQFCLAGQDTAG